MQDLAKLGLLLTCALAIFVGVRTLLIWRATRKVQELAIGINVLAVAVGVTVLTAIGAMSGSTRGLPLVPHALGLIALAAHISALFIGVWKIFRPWASWPIPLLIGVHLVLIVWIPMALAPERFEAISPLVYQGLRSVGMAWAAFECFRYSAMLRRRIALGLADPMIAHRIWLWGVGASASLALTLIESWSFVFRHVALASTPVGLHVTSVFGLIGAVCVALAFFPPERYAQLVLASRRSESG